MKIINEHTCNNCIAKHRCQPSIDTQSKVETGWVTCNCYEDENIAVNNPDEHDWDGTCSVCKFGNVKCNNPKSINFNKRINCTDTCSEYIHHSDINNITDTPDACILDCIMCKQLGWKCIYKEE